MSITFSVSNKRGFLGFQKVLKISELLGFVDGLEPHPIQKEFVYLGLDKLALLRCWVPAKSGRYIDLEYDKTQQTYNVQILTPSTLADWSQALTLVSKLSSRLGTSIRDEHGREYSSSSVWDYPYQEDIVFGLEDFLKSGYPLVYQDGVRRRIALIPQMVEGFLKEDNPAQSYSDFFTLRQYLDAYDAQSKFYGNEQNQQILGVYTLTAGVDTILPFELSLAPEDVEYIDESKLSWCCNLVGCDDTDPDNVEKFFFYKRISYSDLLDRLPKDMAQVFDGEKIYVPAMTFAQMKDLFDSCSEFV
ncbi:hypothetical protein D8811_04715 [Streptococcus gordonii]|jgi:hypothetical protein|uniref:DUF4299 family protein n=1 Tax=Streptococcus gordonii TaxID=1302 RepID=A0AB34SBR4_STRGN|nr:MULTISPECIES: DUF4299 family protein [Streptococcus]KJQ65711.1 hypothetical protein TZ88_00404 [Streptococcus gordonii]OFU70063.1 hypothetical protein HMPREF3108_07850 [Streptococcus sp. HMSC10A01]RSJ57579.1 hypothetical protein D8811_04715 [Streptococcus gordonii]RSK13982.1 hypothetical protein D8806_00350 [Streptococcus gordonii]